MPFVPLETPRKATDPTFPHVTEDEQASRDESAAALVANELANSEDPEQQQILAKEYRLRFGKEAPTARPVARGFFPIDSEAQDSERDRRRGFIPLKESDPGAESVVLRNVALNNPATALGETALNLGSQAMGLPVAGLAGLGAVAGKALGLTDRDPADVVHAVGDALTYEPRGEMGKAAAGVVAYPFEKLHEGATWAGDRALDVTDSPAAATALATAIEGVLPMAVVPGAKSGKGKSGRAAPETAAQDVRTATAEAANSGRVMPDYSTTPENSPALDSASRAGFGEGGIDATTSETRAGRMAGDDTTLPRAKVQGFQPLRREGNSRVPGMAGELSDLPGGRGAGAESDALVRAAGRDAWVLSRELPLDDARSADAQAGVLPEAAAERAGSDHRRGIANAADAGSEIAAPDGRLRPSADRGGKPEAPGEVELDTAGARGKDPAAAGMGDADRGSRGQAARSTETGVAARAGAESGDPASPRSARYALIEADELKPATDTNLRPNQGNPFGRDAPRHEMESAVRGIVKDFDARRVMDAADDAHGAPIVARDGVVEVGQRRATAIQRIYEANGQRAQDYRVALAENAGRFGLDPGAVENMRKPVLVRLPDEAAPRRQASRSGSDLPAEGRANSFAPGANYVGFIDDSPRPSTGGAGVATPESVPTAGARSTPIRREDILVDFAKAMDAGIYEGRVNGKGLMGYFRPKLEEVRIKRHADLETAAHEMAHLLDSRVPEIRKSWHSGKDWQVRREELRGLSYDAGKIYEGFAEFVRLYMTQPEHALAKAPEFSKWFDDFVSRSEYGPAIAKAREGMTSWFGQEAIDRARSKIGDHRPLSDALDGQWDRFRQATVDDLHGVYRMERELKDGKIEANGAYESARLSRASQSIADGALRFGYPVKNADGSFSWKGRGLEEILKPIAENLDDALLYFVGRSSRELLAQGREHLFTNGEIDGMLKLRRPEFDQAFKQYQEWNRGILDFAEAQGVINPASRALWSRTEYMPFHRVGQPDGFRGKPGDWSGIKALTGGTENIRDILGNMTANAAMLIDKAVKNEARQKIADLATKSEGGGKFMVKIPPESRPIKVEKGAVIDAVLESMGINKATNPAAAKVEKKLRKLLEDSPAMIDLLQQGMPPAGGNVVAVLRDGKPTWYEVGDPILLRALQSIDRQPMPWITKWLGLPKRVGQMAITLTPDFMIANIARDTIMGGVMSRAGFRPILDSLQGMRLRLTNDPLYKEFIANGGGMASIFLDERMFRAKLEKFYQKQGISYRTVLDAPDKLLGFMETMADAFEMSTRLGEYRRAVQAGENPRHAAYLGRDVSTDFAMKGDSRALGFMYDTVMFMRPALVSWDRLARGLAHDPNKGAIATKAGIMALMSAGLYLLNKDDERYKDLPDWDRDTHWHFFVGDQHFRYPKIWEIGAMSSAAERTVEKIIEADPKGLGKDFARILGATFNLNLMPQLLAPLYEQATNRNSFTNSPIETPGMENVQPFMRAKPTTSETMKAAGMATRDLPEALQVNPVRTEALLRGYFNTWALYGLAMSDHAFFGDKLPDPRADQMPVVRRFYSQDPPLHTKWETRFYDVLGEAKRLHGTLRELDKIGQPDIADEKEKSPLSGENKPLERANKNLQTINADMRKVRRDDAMTSADKRERLDDLTRQRNDLLKRATQEAEASIKDHAERNK